MKLDHKQLTPKPNTSVLEMLEAHGYQPRSECRDGFCGSCRIKATGNPQYVKDPLGYTKHGEILICCVASSSDIDIESCDISSTPKRQCA
ncbi:2Fe-2S iron-sulfur cluster-binding protein (plasmid) [Vibrio scophthalmi]|uniref:2Fe-2S iron-sulfur cluster-binding protein n=1 Tax=Vibrio scophthalmi TaxID=45658 RepID=UPI003EBEBCF5